MPNFTSEAFTHLEEIIEEIALVPMPDVCPSCDEILSDEATICPDCSLRLRDNAVVA